MKKSTENSEKLVKSLRNNEIMLTEIEKLSKIIKRLQEEIKILEKKCFTFEEKLRNKNLISEQLISENQNLINEINQIKKENNYLNSIATEKNNLLKEISSENLKSNNDNTESLVLKGLIKEITIKDNYIKDLKTRLNELSYNEKYKDVIFFIFFLTLINISKL